MVIHHFDSKSWPVNLQGVEGSKPEMDRRSGTWCYKVGFNNDSEALYYLHSLVKLSFELEHTSDHILRSTARYIHEDYNQ